MPPFTKFICTECGHSEVPCKHWWESKDTQRFKLIEHELLEIIHLLRGVLIYPRSGIISQVGQEQPMTPAGGTSTFVFTPIPAGAVFPAGTTFSWSVDDTADISLTTNGLNVTAVCVAAPTGTSYNLTFTSSYTRPGASAPISATLNVPIGPPAPPLVTGGSITQTS